MTTPISAQIASGSTNGRPIAVAATSSPGTTLHAATSTSGQVDEVSIYVTNVDASARELTLERGGTSTSDTLKVTIPAKSGDVLVMDGLRFNGGVVIKAWASAANVLNATVVVNRVG